MSSSSTPEPVMTKTVDGDVGVLTYQPLDPAKIEESVRSLKAGAVVSFVGIIFFSLSFWVLP